MPRLAQDAGKGCAENSWNRGCMTRAKEPRQVFVCRECGYESAKWLGFCPAPACGSNLPLTETRAAPAGNTRRAWLGSSQEPLQELSRLDLEDLQRLRLPSEELNRVLGGGIVPGSVSLLAGEPGVGKSTLLLQVAQYFSAAGQRGPLRQRRRVASPDKTTRPAVGLRGPGRLHIVGNRCRPDYRPVGAGSPRPWL